MGDSMSIDDYAGGDGCGAASLLYRNRDEDFPEWRGRDLTQTRPGIVAIPLARDGATSEAALHVQMPQILDLGLRPSVVTLTLGGNDLLQSYGDDGAVREALQRFRNNADAVLAELRSLCGVELPILLSTIYDPSDGTGDTNAMGIAPWPTALSWIRSFNETIRQLASAHGATLVDTYAAFQGHGLKVGAPSQSEARPENRELYYCGVVEPNAWGASALRGLWWDALMGTRGIPAE